MQTRSKLRCLGELRMDGWMDEVGFRTLLFVPFMVFALRICMTAYIHHAPLHPDPTYCFVLFACVQNLSLFNTY